MKEWNETKLEEEMEALIHDIPKQDDLEKKIIKSINRRIRKIVLCTMSGITAVLFVIFLIINPVLTHMYFNPYELNAGEEQKLLGVLRDYCETTHPFREVAHLEVKEKGFARYDLEMQIADLTEPLSIGSPNVWCEINFGKYENVMDADSCLTHHIGRFARSYEEQSELMDRFFELPQSSMIYLSVSDVLPRTIEELRSLPATVTWIQVYQPNAEFNGGLSLEPRVLYDESDRQREKMTDQELLDVYRSNLENLLNYKEAWSALELNDGRTSYFATSINSELDNTYEDAKTLTLLESKNYCIYGKRDEIIEFLQENPLDSVFIEKIRLW